MLDRFNYHLFQPLLYQVATAVLSAGDITTPIRSLVRGHHTTVLLAEARSVDLERKVVLCEDGEVPFDTLVLATGVTHSYFGYPEWMTHAPGLKTVDDALEIRRRVLLAFEAAERESDPERQRQWLTFVIIGGGPTGVELAGALAELTRRTLAEEYRHSDPSRSRILLLEALPRLLPQWPEPLSEVARRALEQLGVEVCTGTQVTGVDAEGVSLGERHVWARTVLWGAGVAASPLARSLGAPLDKAGRVQVEPTLALPGRTDVFVVGDLASLVAKGRPVPGLAPAARQMGRHVARNIRRQLAGRPLEVFRYRDRGALAVIGHGHAVGVLLRKLNLRGRPAYLLWLAVHLYFLTGLRNRLAVMMDLAYTFLFTRRRNVRLITGRNTRALPRIEIAQPGLA